MATQREYLLALEAGAATDSPSPPFDRERTLLLESARARLELFDVDGAQIAELERTRIPRRHVVLHSPIGGYVMF